MVSVLIFRTSLFKFYKVLYSIRKYKNFLLAKKMTCHIPKILLLPVLSDYASQNFYSWGSLYTQYEKIDKIITKSASNLGVIKLTAKYILKQFLLYKFTEKLAAITLIFTAKMLVLKLPQILLWFSSFSLTK